jgi:hypothetical protein
MSMPAHLTASVLRQLADRVEHGEHVSPELEQALEREARQNPATAEEIAAFEAARGPVPEWVGDELDRRRAASTGVAKKPAREFLGNLRTELGGNGSGK